MTSEKEKWASKALDAALTELRGAVSGTRNNTLFKVTAKLSAYIADGTLNEDHVRRELTRAALEIGLGEDETECAIESGITRDTADDARYSDGPVDLSRVKFRGRTYDLRGDRKAKPRLRVVPDEPAGMAEVPVAPRMSTMRVTFYANVKTTAGSGEEIDWGQLATMVAEPDPWPTNGKMGLPLWSPCELEGDDRGRRPDGIDADGRERMREPTVTAIHALVLDFDDDPTWSIEQVRRWWGGVCYVAHSSAHHQIPKDKHPSHGRGRVVMALSRPVSESEHAELAEWVLAAGRGNPGRKELANPRRAYFVPAAAPGGYEFDANVVGDGLDVDAILAAQRDTDPTDDMTPDPDVVVVLDFVRGVGDRPDRIRDHNLNILRILTLDPRWAGRVRFNEFCGQVEVDGATLSDVTETKVAFWLSEVYGIHPPTARVHEVVAAIATDYGYHPVRDYLRSLRWDGKPRLHVWLADCLGCARDQASAAIGSRWLIAAVARVFRPGCKVDEMLILRGAQGVGKSRALRALCGASWFCDTALPLGDKDAFQQLNGVWIYELGEMASVRRTEWETVKAFLSSQVDRYRPSYGRNTVQVPRQVIFAASTNEATFLGDSTGQRRFWVRETGVCRPELVAELRDQLWAEAVALFNAGAQWHLTPEEAETVAAATEQYCQQDPWTAAVAEWTYGRPSVSTRDVLVSAIGKRLEDCTRGDEMRIASILSALGRSHKKERSGWVWVVKP